jgi:hypothetical protein
MEYIYIYIISKLENEFIFWKNIIIRFVNVETNPRLQYTIPKLVFIFLTLLDITFLEANTKLILGKFWNSKMDSKNYE